MNIGMRLCCAVVCLLLLQSGVATAAANTKKNATPPAKNETQLSDGERNAIDVSRYVASGLLGTFIGFGSGHPLQARWSEKGWIFTASELGAVTLAGIGVASCGGFSSDGCAGGKTVFYIAGAALLGLRIWEIFDIWTVPFAHSKKAEKIQEHMEKKLDFSLNSLPLPNGAALLLEARF